MFTTPLKGSKSDSPETPLSQQSTTFTEMTASLDCTDFMAEPEIPHIPESPQATQKPQTELKPAISIEKAESTKKKPEKLIVRLEKEISGEFSKGILFKKIHRIARKEDEIKNFCCIPVLNVIMMVAKDGKMVRVHSAFNFKVLYTKRFEKAVSVVRYVSECEKVFFGGEEFLLEIYNPKTRKTEAVCNVNLNERIDEIVWLKEQERIAVGTKNRNIYVLSEELTVSSKVSVSVFCDEPIHDIIDMGNETLLVTRLFFNIKRVSICDLRTRQSIDFPHVGLSLSSSLKVSKRENLYVITCLASLPEKSQSKSGRFRLIQLIQNDGSQELTVHKVGPESRVFSEFIKIEGTEYFAVRFSEGSVAKTGLAKVLDEDIQLTHTFEAPECQFLQGLSMIKRNLIMLGMGKAGGVFVYNSEAKEEDPEESSIMASGKKLASRVVFCLNNKWSSLKTLFV